MNASATLTRVVCGLSQLILFTMKRIYFMLSSFLILGAVACQTEPVVPVTDPSGARATATTSGPVDVISYTGDFDALKYINYLRVRGCIYKGKTYPAVPALTVDATLTPTDFPVAYPVSRDDRKVGYIYSTDLMQYMGRNALPYRPIYGIYYSYMSSPLTAFFGKDALFNIGVGSSTASIIAPQGIMTASLKRFSERLVPTKGYKFIIFSR